MSSHIDTKLGQQVLNEVTRSLNSIFEDREVKVHENGAWINKTIKVLKNDDNMLYNFSKDLSKIIADAISSGMETLLEEYQAKRAQGNQTRLPFSFELFVQNLLY